MVVVRVERSRADGWLAFVQGTRGLLLGSGGGGDSVPDGLDDRVDQNRAFGVGVI
jgi:hypothetical protein